MRGVNEEPGKVFNPTEICSVKEVTSTARKKVDAGAQKTYVFTELTQRGLFMDKLDTGVKIGVLGTFGESESEVPQSTPPDAVFSIEVPFKNPQQRQTGHIGREAPCPDAPAGQPDEPLPVDRPPLKGLAYLPKGDKADAIFQELQGEANLRLTAYARARSPRAPARRVR